MLGRFARSTMIRRAFTIMATLSILSTSILSAEDQAHLSYPELGLTTSFSLVHPSIGYWWDHTGLRLTGMYVNRDLYEFHLNIGYGLYDTQTVQHSVNLLTSWVAESDPGADYRYAATGIAYSLNYKGFFVEIGLARPWRDDLGNLANDPVVPCGYCGYIYRFR